MYSIDVYVINIWKGGEVHIAKYLIPVIKYTYSRRLYSLYGETSIDTIHSISN